jgi:hypothetical protein
MIGIQDLCPPEGRFRAELMSCDQINSLLYVNLPSTEMKDRFRPGDLQGALASAPSTASRRDAFATVPETVKDYFGSYGHELDHLHRQFSTSCGFLCLHLHCLLNWASKALIGKWLEDQDSDLPFPMLPRFENQEWLIGSASDFATYRDWSSRNNHRATVLAAFAAAAGLYGIERGARVSDRVLADAGMVLSSGGGTGVFAPIGFAHPHIRPEIDEWLGAQDLYEHMAMLQELRYRTQIGGGIREWQSLLACDSRYRRILLLWHHFFPDAHLLDQGSMRPTDVITDVYRIFPVEFYAVADLAMWIPYAPHGFRIRNRPLRWEDVQPGTRFLRAVDCLKGVVNSLTPISSSQREARFDEVQRWIADQMDWEYPGQLAKEWHNYFRSNDWLDEQVFLGNPANPMARLASTLLARRLERPFDAVCNNYLSDGNVALGFSLWMTHEADASCQMHYVGDQEAAAFTRQNYFVFRGLELLLFGRDRQYHLARLNDGERQNALETVTNSLDVGQTERSRFREAAAYSFRV